MTVVSVAPLNWTCDPLEVLAAWPPDLPLVALHSARPHRTWARWSILAAPRGVLRLGGRPAWIALHHDGDVETATTGDPAADLAALDGPPRPRGRMPFRGGWIGYLGYDLGRHLERTARHAGAEAAVDDRGWPAGEFAWCPEALVHDHAERRWYAVGGSSVVPRLRRRRPEGFRAAAPASCVSDERYRALVRRALRYIVDGDIFQANIAHRLTASFRGSTRALAARALRVSGARYGAYLELPGDRCVLSLSPELLVDADLATRRVVTRPVKGTRPGSGSRRELAGSAKDAAELNMIVDLMRNDLGRICEYGSVCVPRARMIERHPTVLHGVGEVRGRLRAGVSFSDLVAAAFPAGSVTGAPKIRAMQIIDELEPVRRGPYCGAVGFVEPGGRAVLNVAIRTIGLLGRRDPGCWSRLTGLLDYAVGAGIVADSDPAAEYRETLDKAAVLRLVLSPPHRSVPAAAAATSGAADL